MLGTVAYMSPEPRRRPRSHVRAGVGQPWAPLLPRFSIWGWRRGHVPEIKHRPGAGAGAGSRLHPRTGSKNRNWTERGELAKAYRDAQNFVDRQPKNATAHFVLGYVLRYAGLPALMAFRNCRDAVPDFPLSKKPR